MKQWRASLWSALAAGLWRAALVTTAWGQGDDDYTVATFNNELRTFNGTGNNEAQPVWGSVGQTQLRSVTVASYSDGESEPPGENRPSARSVLSEVFLATPPSSSATSALFVGWGLLLGYDLFLNEDNPLDPLDIECNNASLADVWCPEGSQSDPIPFYRSEGELDTDGDGARSPTNFATAYVDLDWLYGRDEESAEALRTLESGYLKLTDDELPFLLSDGTWLVADQRPTTMPVTFALMTLLMREHNRCCDEWAGDWGADSDEDVYQACRQWTIAVFQHITENDFAVRLLGANVKTLGQASYDELSDDDNDTVSGRRRRRLLGVPKNVVRSRYLAEANGDYDAETNAGVDAVFSTVAIPAFYSALPSTVSLLDDEYYFMDEHGIELAVASADVAGLVERLGGIEPILRGGAYSRTQAMDASFNAEVSVSSPLFNLPAVVIQRGRDHGIPSYNDVREGYGLDRVTTFEDITSDDTMQGLLENSYGDVDLLDAYTGALAERQDGSAVPVSPLLQMVFLEQLYRSIVGDRHHHSHKTENEDAALSTLSALILNNSMVSSMALDAFRAPDVVAASLCTSLEENEIMLADGYKVAWSGLEGGKMNITISARGIGTEGMIAIGFGGGGMNTARDFVLCEVFSDSMAVCTDHKQTDNREPPPPDDNQDEGDCALDVVGVEYNGEWTSVTFSRCGSGNDDTDFDLAGDISDDVDTEIVYSWRSGPGVTDQHPTSQRGAAAVNFKDGTASCDDASEYFALHGALLLFAWMVIAPFGIYQARYRKGKETIIGNLWWEMHEECMVICAEALLPLAITAIFTTGGPHNSEHAKWGFYMIGAVFLQLVTGWARARALEAKGNNFSLFHRLNKHFHIYAGWFAYLSGLVQCYRGLELVSGAEKLILPAGDINFTLGNFMVVTKLLVPIWLGIVPVFFLYLEVRKQFARYFTKGAANLCGVVEIVNEDFADDALKKEVEDRLMPRTEELPIYSTHEFNDKILNGRAWVIVDGAVLDVSSFAKRHPGGARVIMNAMGTDVTSEIIGEDASIGNANMTFAPHAHTDTALEIARSLVVGYIEEEDDLETDESDEDEDGDGGGASSGPEDLSSRLHTWLHRPSQSGSDNEGNEKRAPTRGPYRSPRAAHLPLSSQPSMRSGRLASWPGPASSGDEAEGSKRRSSERGRRAAIPRPVVFGDGGGGAGGAGGGSGSDNNADVGERKEPLGSDGSNNGEQRRPASTPLSDSKMKWKAAAAAVIKRANSKPLRMKSFGHDAGSDDESGKKSSTPQDSKKGLPRGGSVAVGAAMTLSAEAAAIANAESPPPKTPVLPGGNATPPFGEASLAPVSSVSGRWSERSPSGRRQDRSPSGRRQSRSPLARSKSFMKPVELDHPVIGNGTTPPSGTRPMAVEKKPKANPVRRMLERMGSQMESMGGGSGDESDSKQEARPFKATRRVWEKKNPLDFFHVCPLLLHEKMGGGAGRPVYKLVFTCPGRAGALVHAMQGVCHFNMRVAQEAGMSVVQRAYNAFAVRVQGEEGVDRRVVPASETSEGELCIEMRIRLYSDGLMSSQLMQLIKNLDNPAVQLQGPFLQDRLIPPPTHRNVVMIAAGTGINPMVQMIRDYINPRRRADGVLLGAHSRLVLLWQNSVEEDIFCADELTILQAKAKGLLEVTALVSGDTTRRNVPGNAFRRAKARLLKQGQKAGLVSRDMDGSGQDGDKFDEDILGGTPFHRLELPRALSRVTEEDCLSRESSLMRNISSGFSGRDLESGVSGGRDSFRNALALRDSLESNSGNSGIAWSSRRGGVGGGGSGRKKGSAKDVELGPKPSSGGEKGAEGGGSSSRNDRGGTGGAGRGSEGGPDGGDGGGDGQKKSSSRTTAYKEGLKHLGCDSSDGSSRPPKGARAGENGTGSGSKGDDDVDTGSSGQKRGPSRGGGATRSSIRLADTISEAKLGRNHLPKSAGKKKEVGQTGEGGGSGGGSGSGGGAVKAKAAKSTVQSHFGRSRSPRIAVVNESSGEEKSDSSAVATGAAAVGKMLSRSHRRTAPKVPPDSSLPPLPSPAVRNRREASGDPSARPGENGHANATAKRTRHGSSRSRAAARAKAQAALVESPPLDDSGSGLQRAKLSTALLEKAIGPEVMRAIASARAAAVANAGLDGSAGAADGSRSAFSEIVGTETTGGVLQVVVSGPAGFVFRAEGFLTELGIPPQAVVLLD